MLYKKTYAQAILLRGEGFKEQLNNKVTNLSSQIIDYQLFRNSSFILYHSSFPKVKTLTLMYKTREHTVYEWIRRYKLHSFIGFLYEPFLKTKLQGTTYKVNYQYFITQPVQKKMLNKAKLTNPLKNTLLY